MPENSQLAVIEEVVATNSMAVLETLPQMQRALALGHAIKRLRELVDDKIMSDIMALAESPLGFCTDRTDRDGKDKPYPVSVIKDAVIQCLLHGGNIVGNEFNVIAGRCYLTKEYYERQVRELVHDLRVVEHVPQMASSGALVPMEASWVYEGRADQLQCLKTDSGDSRIAVRVNAGMGVDAILGKAYRKLYARIYRRVTGSQWLESHAETEVDSVVCPEPDTPAREPPADPLSGLDSALGECQTIREIELVQKKYTAMVSTEQLWSQILDACEARQEAIRANRGERSNEKVNA